LVIIFSFLCILITFFLLYFTAPGDGFNKIFNPFFAYSIFHSVVYYIVPIIQQYYGYGRFDSVYVTTKSDYMIAAVGVAFLYHVVIIFLFSLTRPAFLFENLSFEKIDFDSKSEFGFYTLLILSLIGVAGCVSIIIQNIGNYAFFMYNRINILAGNGIYLMLIKLLFPVSIYIYLKKLKYNGNANRILLIFLVLTIFVVNIFLGSRTSAMLVFIYFFIVLFMVSKTSKKRRLIITGFFGIVLLFSIMSLLGTVRDAVKQDGLDITARSLESSSDFIVEPKVVETLRINYGQTELLAFLIDNFEFNQYAQGNTFVAGFLNFIPRSVWPGKPTGGGPLLANTISPGSYTLGANDGNTSYTTGFIVESYLNLGVLGVILVSIIHFVMLFWLCSYSKKVNNPLSFMIFMFSYIAIIMGFTTGEFLGMFMTFFVTVVPLYCLNKIRVFKK
jgi:oligosaccharide repeat unit polymerase